MKTVFIDIRLKEFVMNIIVNRTRDPWAVSHKENTELKEYGPIFHHFRITESRKEIKEKQSSRLFFSIIFR